MSGFFPVDRGIFTSSVWLGGTSDEKVLWVWLLGNRDDDGVVRHREMAIAYGAGLSRQAVYSGLLKFSQPDSDSRTAANDGRRVERTEDGFVRVLNHELYYSRDYSTPRWRRWKERKGLNATPAVGQQPPTPPTPLPTKDNDKDTDTTENRLVQPPAGPPPRPTLTAVEPESIRTEDVQRIFDHWRDAMGHAGAKLTPERRRYVVARLREGYPVEVCLRAIDACARSPFHRGQNDRGTTYDDLTLIFRSGSKLEWFAGMEHGPSRDGVRGEPPPPAYDAETVAALKADAAAALEASRR